VIRHASTHRADVLIVGAGPAGSVCALLLARAGFDVLVIDRQEFPRAKPCGDCLSAGALPLLARLGLDDVLAALPHARLHGWRIVAPDGTAFDADFNNAHAVAVERALLDDALLRAARAAGARFLSHTRLEELLFDGDVVTGARTCAGDLRAGITIGADGLRSRVAALLHVRAAPGRRKLSLTWHVDLPVAARHHGEMHCGDGVCFGIAPLHRDAQRCNVTMVADAQRFGRHVAGNAAAFAHSAASALPQLRGRLPRELFDARRLGSGPFEQRVHRVVFDGAALVGDAAGYFDPFTGQGVHHAMSSAALLAPVVVHALHCGDTSAAQLLPYAASLRTLLHRPRLLQRAIDAVLARPALANRMIARIAAAPPFADAIIAATGGIAPVSGLLSPRLLSTLLIPPRITERSA